MCLILLCSNNEFKSIQNILYVQKVMSSFHSMRTYKNGQDSSLSFVDRNCYQYLTRMTHTTLWCVLMVLCRENIWFERSVLQNKFLPAYHDILPYCECTRILTACVRKFNFWPWEYIKKIWEGKKRGKFINRHSMFFVFQGRKLMKSATILFLCSIYLLFYRWEWRMKILVHPGIKV